MATKYIAYGTILQVDHDSNGSFTAIGQLADLNGPQGDVDAVDVTTHDSPSARREFKPGLVDEGTVDFELVWDPADSTHQILSTLRGARTVCPWRIVWVNGTTTSFSGFVTTMSPVAPVDDKLACSFTIRTTGVVTWA